MFTTVRGSVKLGFQLGLSKVETLGSNYPRQSALNEAWAEPSETPNWRTMKKKWGLSLLGLSNTNYFFSLDKLEKNKQLSL